jgi:DnaJ family protein C protein 27
MSGHPFFHEVRNEFYKDSQGVLLVFDVNEKSTFDSLEMWLNEMKQDMEVSKSNSNFDNLVVVVCANKIDKGKRVVDELEARIWAHSKGFHYFETSASSGTGVNEMFDTMFTEIVSMIENGGKQPNLYQTNIGLNKEQIEAIQRLKNSKDNYERLGLRIGCTREEINNSFRRLAKLLHPGNHFFYELE